MLGRVPVKMSGGTVSYVMGFEIVTGGKIPCNISISGDYAILDFGTDMSGAVYGQVYDFYLSGATSGYVLTSTTSGKGAWRASPPASTPDPLDASGALIDVLSGVIATFNSGISTVSISGNIIDVSGATIDIVSGFLGHFPSGVITPYLSGVLGFVMSGATSGRVLTSDTSGIGTWQTPAGGGGTTEPTVTLVTHAPGTTWTNQPAALTEVFGTTANRTTTDLSGYTQVRFVASVSTVGASVNTVLRAQGSTNGTNFSGLETGTTPQLAISPTGVKDTGWLNLATVFKANSITIRIMGLSGNGAADPVFGYHLYVK